LRSRRTRLETDDYNFTKLKLPDGHPAREMHDTFFFNPSRRLAAPAAHPYLTGAVRTMLASGADPGGLPGRTYRRDSDQTHTPMFHQVEGLVVDKGSHLGI